jgi:periplasmic copper chaperone A
MRQTLSVAVIGTAVAALLSGPCLAQAQSQTIQISNAWARSAPMAHGDMGSGSMGTGSMDKMAKGSMDKSSMQKGEMGKMEGANGAVYVTVTNTGTQADALLSASSDVARTVELHEVKNDGGVMKMRPVAKIDVPAGGKIEMKPGGYHVMLLGLKRDLKKGDKVPVTLKFERGGEVSAEAAVR